MRLLGLCHDIIVEEKGDVRTYNAASPDELALVNFAKFSNYEYMGIDDEGNMRLRVEDKGEELYHLEHILEFTSTRKRMSVIVKN